MVIRVDRKRGFLSLRGLFDILLRIRREMGIDKPGAGWHAFRRGGITILHKEGMSAKAISTYTEITKEIVNKYIQLEKTEATVMFTEAHPFLDNGRAVKEEVDGDVGS